MPHSLIVKPSFRLGFDPHVGCPVRASLEPVQASSGQKFFLNMSMVPRWPYEHVRVVEYALHVYDRYSRTRVISVYMRCINVFFMS